MRSFQKFFTMVSLGILCFFCFQQPLGAEDWDQVLEAARKEGKVVASIPSSSALRRGMETAFENRFPGIDLEPVPGRGSKNVKRITDEHKAGVRYFDLHVGGSQSMLLGLVLTKKSPAAPVPPNLILPEVRDPKNWWGGHIYADKAQRFAYTFQAYLSKNFWCNTKLVNPIWSFDDLLKPKWKGLIAFHDPRRPGAWSSTWSYMWRVKGEKYLQRLVKQDLLIIWRSRQIAEFLAKGEIHLSIGVTYNSFLPFLKADLPVKPLPMMKEGTYVTGGHGNMAFLKNPPHPNAAKVFVNWLLG